MTILPFAEWMPDQPDLADATDIAYNVVAATPSSYGPMYGLAPYSASALNAPCIGLFATQNIDETIYLFAGTPADLFQMSATTFMWNNVSQTAGGYFAPRDGNWRFAQYNQLILATDFSDPIQVFTMGTSTAFSTLSTEAPNARFISVAKTFCIVANTSDPVGGTNPARLWWSAAGDPTNWPIPGSTTAQQTQSDYTDLVGPLGDITGLVANLAGCDCAVFFERGIYRMFYVGPPDIFDLFPAENVRGTRAPNAVVPLGNLVYYLADDGFYSFDGNSSTPIGANKIDRWFLAQVNPTYLQNVIGTADIAAKTITWIAPSLNSPTGVPDFRIVYRWDIQRWTAGDLSNPAGPGAQFAAPALTFGISMDAMPAAGYTDTDTLPYSLDSRYWVGGAPQSAFVDAAGHLAFPSATSLQAQVGTKALQITPNRLSFVQSARPLVDGGAPMPTIAVSSRVNYYDPEVYGPDVATNRAGECPQRQSGRYHRARVTVPAGQPWAQAFGVDLTAIPGGTV